MSLEKHALVQNLRSILHRIAEAYASAQDRAQAHSKEPAQTQAQTTGQDQSRDTSIVDSGASESTTLLNPIKTSLGLHPSKNLPQLVAVSKTFPAECVLACYEAGQRHFGENYLNELQEKSLNLLTSCPDIRWHFIGRIQSNKIRKICEIPNLWCVQTVENEKHADLLQKSCTDLGIMVLRVFIQVNTSGESGKNGVDLLEKTNANKFDGDTDRSVRADALETLAQYVVEKCPNLKLLGLMTIGSLAQSRQSENDVGTLNPDFCALVEARERVCNALRIPESRDLELSMGMSHDFEAAIRHGATVVRVGSSIFGARNYNKT